MEIMKRIEEIALKNRITVSLVELSDKCIKIKAAEGESLASTFKCSNKPEPTFLLANHALKRYINVFKNYQLPDEAELNVIFENTVKEKFQSISMDEFTEDEERRMKNEILNRPSIEKLYVYKVELKSETKDDLEIEYYSIKVLGANQLTNANEEDELIVYAHNTPAIENAALKEHYGDFRKALEEYLDEGRNHYLGFLKQCEAERQADFRRLVLSASQGNLFTSDEFKPNEYEQKYLTEKAKEFFPNKFKGGRYIGGSADETEEIVDDYEVEDIIQVADWAMKSDDPARVVKGQLLKNEAERKKKKGKKSKPETAESEETNSADISGMEF